MQPIKPYAQWKERAIEVGTGLKTQRITQTVSTKEKIHRKYQKVYIPARPYATTKPRTQLGKTMIPSGKRARKLKASEMKRRKIGHKAKDFNTGRACECTFPGTNAMPVAAPKTVERKNKKRPREGSQSTQRNPAKRRLINQSDEGIRVIPSHPDDKVSGKDLNGTSDPGRDLNIQERPEPPHGSVMIQAALE